MSEKTIVIRTIKIGLLGDPPVGKTCILNSFISGTFEEFKMTNEGDYKAKKIIEIKNGKKINVIVYDTAGNERFRSISLQQIRSVHGIILIFDLTRKNTFNNIDGWMKTIEDNFDKPNIVLFGNKADIDKSKWKITEEEVENLAQQYNLKYFETSAKTNMNINEGFNYIVNICYNRFKENYENNIKLKNKKEDKNGCIGKEKKNKNKKGK